MDITPPAIQSYQTNQNLAGWAQETGQVKAANNDIKATEGVFDDEVSLSNKSLLINWIAEDLPPDTFDSARIIRAAHSFFEYGNLAINELNTLNSTLGRFENRSVLDSLTEGMNASETLSDRRSHERLIQVFSTLAAASQQIGTAA